LSRPSPSTGTCVQITPSGSRKAFLMTFNLASKTFEGLSVRLMSHFAAQTDSVPPGVDRLPSRGPISPANVHVARNCLHQRDLLTGEMSPGRVGAEEFLPSVFRKLNQLIYENAAIIYSLGGSQLHHILFFAFLSLSTPYRAPCWPAHRSL